VKKGFYIFIYLSKCSDHDIFIIKTVDAVVQMEGLKMIVRWLLGVKSSSPSTVTPTLRLLYSMVLAEGDLTESKRIRFGLARLLSAVHINYFKFCVLDIKKS